MKMADMTKSSDDTHVIHGDMIETPQAVRNARRFAAVPGIEQAC